MCGYCTEQTALDILKRDMTGALQMKELGSDVSRFFYLRESPDFLLALDRLKRSLAQKRLSFSPGIPHQVLLYRGLEILLQQGYSSPAYQRLLKHPLYRDTVATLCNNEQRNDFVSATAGLNDDYLGVLYEPETYFWGERSKELRTLANVLPSCRNMLKHYISWWLDGKNLKKVDESCLAKEEYSRFSMLFRAVYFSVLMVGSCSAGKKMVGAIVEKEPAATPSVVGDDLWLQRVAALKLYDLAGFDAFSKHLTTTRATNFYFIDIVRGFSLKQKQLLLDEVRRHAETDTSDNYVSLSRWLIDEVSGEI